MARICQRSTCPFECLWRSDMVERVRITPNLMRLRNASGGIVFDTNNRYIKTESPGDLSLAQSSPAPYPLRPNQISYSMGTLIHWIPSVAANQTYSVEYTPAVSGFFAVHPALGLGGGGVPRGEQVTVQDIISVSQGSTKIWSRKVFALLFADPSSGGVQLTGVLASLSKSGDAVGDSDLIPASAGLTYRFHKDSTSMTSAPSSGGTASQYTFSGHNIAIHFLTGLDTLPLKVTV